MNTTCNLAANSSCTGSPLHQPNPYARFFQFAFGSSIYMIVVAFITVVANSLLLLIFFLDPLKTFGNSTSYFLVALAFVDLITGLVQEPIFASCFVMGYFRHPAAKQYCPKLLQIGQILSMTTMNTSFIIVLAFTIAQLIAITAPFNYAALVTRTKVIITVLGIYGYGIGFGLLHLVQLPDPNTLTMVDLFLHSFFVVYFTIVIYILLYRAFRRRMEVSRSLRSERNSQENKSVQRSNRVGRKFVVLNFLLICLVFFCAQPSAVLLLLKLFWFGDTQPGMLIASLMVDNVLYLKFMLDPFLYAWRVPKYRMALKTIFRCGRLMNKKREKPPGEFRLSWMNIKSTDTVVVLSIKSLPESGTENIKDNTHEITCEN